MVSIARKNLLHDKVRFSVALAGITFAVVLITIQVGVYLAFLANASVLIDHTEADIWITAHGLENFDFGRPISEKKLYEAREVPGVLWAEKYLLAFGYWKTPGGSQETVQMVGYDPDTLVGAPWNIVRGNPQDVKYFNSVFYDEAETNRLGDLPIGGETEINSHRVRVVGIIRGAKSFIQSPYIFTSFKNALNLSFVAKGNTVYILVKVEPGYSIEAVQQRLKATVKDVDVYTSREFSKKTRDYWMINTGTGMALLSIALMGVVIGTVIVANTIYTSTTEHLKEFGTLKAIGASNWDLYKIIIEQALINSVIGYVAGEFVSFWVIQAIKRGNLQVLLPWQVLAGIYVLTALMCLWSSTLSIYKVTKIDPALVFKS
ncbi:MAG: ABC transporter permease [Acidobacteriia bacterium]|nr:ABC transporter permease [Terriglobia bacterium]